MSEIIKAYRKIVVLNFPPDVVEKPMVCNLARLFDVSFNILQAQITPRREGFMTLEIIGSEENCTKSISYLKEHSIKISEVAQKISRDEESCIQCGMCTAICPNLSLSLNLADRRVVFDKERCTGCGLCVRVCPVQAMHMEVENGHW